MMTIFIIVFILFMIQGKIMMTMIIMMTICIILFVLVISQGMIMNFKGHFEGDFAG